MTSFKCKRILFSFLGTAVSTEAVARLCENGEPPTALILESPFNNIHDEIKYHPMSYLWRKMPWFKWFFTGTLTKNDVGFVSDQRIGQIYIPILIMHAKVGFCFVYFFFRETKDFFLSRMT